MSVRTLTRILYLLAVVLVVWPVQARGESSARVDRYERARFFYSEGIVFEAIKELELHIERNEDDVGAHVFLAELLSEVGLHEQAATIMTRVLDMDPADAEAERQLSRMRNSLALRVDRSDPDAVLQFARISARPGSYDRAATFYRLALSLEDSTAVHLEFARMLSWAGSYDESAHYYEIVLERSPGALSVKREAGRVFNSQGDFTRAIEVLRAYIDRRPDDVPVLLNLIWAYIWAGKEDEGARLLARVEEISPDRIDIYLVRGALAEREGRILDAYEYYASALEKDANHVDAQMRAAFLEQDQRLAIAQLEARIEEDPRDTDAYLALVDALIEQERMGEAVDLLVRANRHYPDNETIYETLQELRELDSRSIQESLNRYRASLAARQREKIESLRAWLASHPDDVRTRLELAQLLFTAGEYNEAEEQLMALQERVPTHPVAFELINQISTRRRDLERQEAAREGRLLQ